MKLAERIVMVCIVLVLIGGGAWLYFSVQYKEQSIRDAVAQGKYQTPIEDARKELNAEETLDRYYPSLIPVTIASTSMQASVADSISEWIQGLSDTPSLPPNVVKLFVFGVEGAHSIWMKDMNYPIDILWADKKGNIVHIEENISPDTYSEARSESFASPVPAWYVIETNAGFVASSSIKLGDTLQIGG